MKKLNINDANDIAIKNNGECLSIICNGSVDKLLWKCHLGHIWSARLNNVRMGQWCRICRSGIITIEQVKALAIARGGECISKSIVNGQSKTLKFRCKFDHEWVASYTDIRDGTWCQVCKSSSGERLCKLIFEKIFNKSFEKARPSWLINPKTLRNLELDGYNKELNIAFEYNGIQHYESNSLFTKSLTDKIKRKLCLQNNLQLFTIKQVNKLSNFQKIIDQIIKQNEKFKLEINIPFIDINELFHTSKSYEQLIILRQIAINKGGEILSQSYLDTHSKYNFKCKEGHLFAMSAAVVKRGGWCNQKQCNARAFDSFSKESILHFDEMKKIAKNNNGMCISLFYKGCYEKHEFICSKNHKFQKSLITLRKGVFCRKCNPNSRENVFDNLSKLQKIAISKGGLLNSQEYLGDQVKLLFTCKNNHVFYITPSRVKQNDWCATCSKENNISMKKIKELQEKITKARNLYYNTDNESVDSVTDQLFDAWVDELKLLDPTNICITSIGAPVSSEWLKAKHLISMGSLNKLNLPDELDKWAESFSKEPLFVCEKLDGLSINCIYEDGKFVQAITRGNGFEGDDITSNVKKMKGVVPTIPKFTGSLRGEILMKKSIHQHHFLTKANPRNAASGVSKRLDGVGSELLNVLFYQVIGDIDFKTEVEQFEWLTKNKCEIPNYWLFNDAKEVSIHWRSYQDNNRNNLDYDIDGLVVRLNNLAKQLSMGDSDMKPLGARAFKFDNMMAESIIIDLIWQCGNSGRLTPIAIVEP